MAVIEVFKKYFNPLEQRYINATEMAYNAIYRQQGFFPVGDENVIKVPAETETDIQGRSGSDDKGNVSRTGRRRKPS